MSNIYKPSGEESIVSSFIAKLEELNNKPKKQYKIKAHYGTIYRFVTVESHRTATELLDYYVALIHSGRPVYMKMIVKTLIVQRFSSDTHRIISQICLMQNKSCGI